MIKITNVNVSVERLAENGLASNSGKKFGYVKATAKAAQNDTITIVNAKSIIDADLRIDATGVAEGYTISGNVITLTSATTGSVRGKIVYR